MLEKNSVVFPWVSRLVTPLIDLLSVLLYSALLPVLISIFSRQAISGTLIVAGGYGLMCTGIFAGKRLRPWPRDGEKKNRMGPRNSLVLVLSWPYAIFVVVMMLDAGGAFVKDSELGGWLDRLSSGSPLILLPVILCFLIILTLFPLLLLMKPRLKISNNRLSHILLRVFAMMTVDLMALITAAYWQWQMADSPPMDISLAGRILVFVLVYIVFLMFYAPPRLALISLEPSRWSFAGYAVVLGYLLWGLMS